MRLAVALACALLSLVPAATARADGDPASDVLIKERVFYPYQLRLPRASTSALEQTIARAAKGGYRVRVAMIAHDFDLGSAGMLYRQPRNYAKFLAQELAQFHSEWVLIVMPNGYGIYHCVGIKRAGGYVDPCEGGRPTGADEKLLASLPTQERSRKDFAAVSELAVRRLAEAHGVSFGNGFVVPLLLGVGVLACGAAVLVARRRRRDGRDVTAARQARTPAGT